MIIEGEYQNLACNTGDAVVVVKLDKSMKADEHYSFFIYTDDLMLMADAETGQDTVERRGRVLQAHLHGRCPWMPGNYFLLLRWAHDDVLRYDLQLDEHHQWHVDATPTRCQYMSREDILSGTLIMQRAAWSRLSSHPGARQLKEWCINRAMQNRVNASRCNDHYNPLEMNDNLLVAYRSRIWRTMVPLMMKRIGNIEGELCPVDCAILFDPTRSNAFEELHSIFGDSSAANNPFDMFQSWADDSRLRIYCFRNIGALVDTGGKNLMRAILRHCPTKNKKVIFMGTQQEIDALLEQNPTLQQYFPPQNRLSEEPYSCQDMLRLFFSEADGAHLLLSCKAREKAWRVVGKAWRQGIISNWTMEDMRQWVNDELVPANMKGLIQRRQQLRDDQCPHLMLPEDLDAATLLRQQSSFDAAMHELNQMVGLDELKQSITTLARRMRFNVERRQLGLPINDMATYHAVFTGNPGTGKTTVARLLGKIYHSLGLLSRGEVVCAERSTMVGRYIGETEENMKHLLEEARGNVLFVDEAYTLYNKNDDKDFGRHAVEALLVMLSRHNPDMLIVFAGYQKEMDNLMQMNPGLAGRFPYKFHFLDYSAPQLMQIVERVLQRDSYELTDDARQALQQGIALTVQNRTDTFANARWAEQLVMNGIIPAMADRIASAPHAYDRAVYQRIEAVDVDVALERFGVKAPQTRQRRTIGFCA